MKRVIFLLIFSLILGTTAIQPAQAGFIADKKAQIQQNKKENNFKKEIRELFEKQDKYAQKHDIKGVQSFYSSNFVDNDGYTKDVYFSLVEETWETYPDITYTTKINNIDINGALATVETFETSVATADDLDKKLLGELFSESRCRYHLQRFSNKWEITGLEVFDEFSALKYGDARYVKMHLETPKVIGAGQEYTSTLKVDLPSDYVVIASLNQEKIVNPATKPQETFKKLSDEQVLARVFTANTDNVNEYTVASIGITGAEMAGKDKIRVYVNGLAFVMSRINVIPKNNFARVDRQEKEMTEDKI